MVPTVSVVPIMVSMVPTVSMVTKVSVVPKVSMVCVWYHGVYSVHGANDS